MIKKRQYFHAFFLEMFPLIYFFLSFFVSFKFIAPFYISIDGDLFEWFFSPFSLFCIFLYLYFTLKILEAFVFFDEQDNKKA